MKQRQISRVELASYLLSPPLFVMLALMTVEAMLAAGTTWLVINAGRKVANGQFLLSDLIWILTAQSASYVAGVISWVFAERAGYRGFGKFMLRFARENRGKVKLFNDRPAREQVEPFLTGETFQCFFSLMYELEFALKLFLGLVFNALVLGAEIDLSLPFAYVGAFAALLVHAVGAAEPDRAHLSGKPAHEQPGDRAGLYRVGQYLQRQRLQSAALARRLQDPAARGADRANPRHRGARRHERDERHRQPRHRVRHHDRGRVHNAGNMALLIALATTLPRQIEMTYELHLLATGWNDFIAIWTRFGGVAANMLPQPDQNFDDRIKFDRLVLREGEDANVVSSVNDALRIVRRSRPAASTSAAPTAPASPRCSRASRPR